MSAADRFLLQDVVALTYWYSHITTAVIAAMQDQTPRDTDSEDLTMLPQAVDCRHGQAKPQPATTPDEELYKKVFNSWFVDMQEPPEPLPRPKLSGFIDWYIKQPSPRTIFADTIKDHVDHADYGDEKSRENLFRVLDSPNAEEFLIGKLEGIYYRFSPDTRALPPKSRRPWNHIMDTPLHSTTACRSRTTHESYGRSLAPPVVDDEGEVQNADDCFYLDFECTEKIYGTESDPQAIYQLGHLEHKDNRGFWVDSGYAVVALIGESRSKHIGIGLISEPFLKEGYENEDETACDCPRWEFALEEIAKTMSGLGEGVKIVAKCERTCWIKLKSS